MKKTKIIFAFVLALALCLGGMATAAAAPPEGTPPKGTVGTATTPAQAAITKLLQMPEGTAIPNAVFKFKVTSVTVDGVTATETNMPIIGTPISGEAAGIYAFDSFAGNKTPVTTGGITTTPMQSADILAAKKGNWPHAGVYVYTVEEVSNTYAADATHEIMNYSPAKYTLNVYVKDNGSGVYFAWLIGAYVTVKDDQAQDTDVKLNVTPDGGDDTTLTYSQMTFTNKYVHTNGTDTPDNPDPTDPDQATLTISKKVDGAYASTGIFFDFKLTITNPAIDVSPALPSSYKGYIVEGSTVSAPITFNVGSTPTSFQLKHGQSLVFVNTPVGTDYTVEENGTLAYEAKLVISNPSSTATGTTPGAGVSGKGKVGEQLNTADFTNKRDDVTPTGLNLNDIPFIGLIALALSAAAFFIVIKLRRRNNYSQANL